MRSRSNKRAATTALRRLAMAAACSVIGTGLSPTTATAAVIATLLRVTLDNKPVDQASTIVTPYAVETALIKELQNRSHQTVDLTPLHADFQKLRYTHDCPVLDGDFSHNDCAQFGNYAEAVIQVLDNVRYGADANVASLQPLAKGGHILVAEVKAHRKARQIVGYFHFRVHGFCDGSLPVAQTQEHDIAIPPNQPAESALRQFFEEIIEDSVAEAHSRLKNAAPSC